ncbi:respiratory complex assembly protein Rmp1 [Colletotrichum asianum]
MASLINKNRKIYDLNNVPLVSGTSIVKWHLSHSIIAEHRGRTPKCPISNHKVEYNYQKVVSHIRISIDKNNHLTECPVEFEVLQEFSGGGHDEKISLGKVQLNLSEYVEESDGLTRESSSFDRGHARKRSSGTASTSPKSMKAPILEDPDVEDGIVRRYLMQDSKINSTLKIGILMRQLDGDKGYSAPPLRTAPVFGGIAGIMAGEQVEQDDAGQIPTMAKSRDASEVQDMYRRALAASWSCQPGELPADECIEDIFSGGDGWRTGRTGRTGKTATFDLDNNGSVSSDEGGMGTLRPSDLRKLQQKQERQKQQQQQQQQKQDHHHHLTLHLHQNGGGNARNHSRSNSGSSDRSFTTVLTARANDGASSTTAGIGRRGSRHGRRELRDDDGRGGRSGYPRSRSRSGSMASLAPTIGSSDRGRDSRRNRELEEFDVRDDLVAWRLPGAVS